MLLAAAFPCLFALAQSLGLPFDDFSDSLSLLQTSPAHRITTALTRQGLSAAHARRWTTGYPRPDAPGYKATAAHRAAVLAFKAAVAARSVPLINITAMAMGLLPVELEVEEGVYPLMFQVLNDYSQDEHEYVQQHTWRGLSDQAFTEAGAAAMSDLGGKREGVRFLVRQLRAHPSRLYGYCADQCTVQYEALAVVAGLVLTDISGARTAAAMEEGFGDAVVHAMRSENDVLATMHTACRAMSYLLWHNTSWAQDFKAAGALELVKEAMERFRGGDERPFHFGFALGEMYPISQCAGPKLQMEGRLAEAKKAWEGDVAALLDWKPYFSFVRPK